MVTLFFPLGWCRDIINIPRGRNICRNRSICLCGEWETYVEGGKILVRCLLRERVVECYRTCY